PDPPPPPPLGPATSACHHFAEPARHDRGSALGKQPPDLLGVPLVLGSAADDRDLDGHLSAMLGHVSTVREACGGVLVVGGGFAGGYVARELGTRGATVV